MDSVIKIITIAGTIYGASGIISVLLGFFNFQSGTKHDDPMKAEKGTQQMLWGGASALIATGVVAACVTSLNAIQF